MTGKRVIVKKRTMVSDLWNKYARRVGEYGECTMGRVMFGEQFRKAVKEAVELATKRETPNDR